MPRQYRQIPPEAKDDYYIANEVVEWELTTENNSIKAGSLYISGYLQVRKNVTTYESTPSGDPITNDDLDSDRIYIDPFVGIHSFFTRFSSETAQGVIENLDTYPRLVGMIADCNMYKDDMTNETDKQMALQCGDRNFARTALLPLADDVLNIPFCFRPMITLNSSSADMPFRRTGLVKVSTRLAPLSDALFGEDWNSTCGYWLSDLYLHYEVVPDDGNNDPITMQYFQTVPRPIDSTKATISAVVAGLSNSMACSFLKGTLQSDLYLYNQLQRSVLPQVTRVTFAFNDADNVRLAYPIENNEELQLNYERSLGVEGTNSLLLSKQHQVSDCAQGFGIGISFGTLKNLTNSKFSCDIQTAPGSDAPSSTNRYKSFSYFRGIAQM